MPILTTNCYRNFGDQVAIFGPEMSGTWSGAIIYEWVNEVNDYGVVDYKGTEYGGTPLPMEPEFSTLKKIWKSATPNAIKQSDYTPQKPSPVCPPSVEGAWKVDGDAPLPTLGATVKNLVKMKKRFEKMGNRLCARQPSGIAGGIRRFGGTSSGAKKMRVGVQSGVLGLVAVGTIAFVFM